MFTSAGLMTAQHGYVRQQINKKKDAARLGQILSIFISCEIFSTETLLRYFFLLICCFRSAFPQTCSKIRGCIRKLWYCMWVCLQLSAVSQCECSWLRGDLFPCSGQMDRQKGLFWVRSIFLISKLFLRGVEGWKEIEREREGVLALMK